MPQNYLLYPPEKEMRNTILTMFTAMLLPIAASAQFYTITKETEVLIIREKHQLTALKL